MILSKYFDLPKNYIFPHNTPTFHIRIEHINHCFFLYREKIYYSESNNNYTKRIYCFTSTSDNSDITYVRYSPSCYEHSYNKGIKVIRLHSVLNSKSVELMSWI